HEAPAATTNVTVRTQDAHRREASASDLAGENCPREGTIVHRKRLGERLHPSAHYTTESSVGAAIISEPELGTIHGRKTGFMDRRIRVVPRVGIFSEVGFREKVDRRRNSGGNRVRDRTRTAGQRLVLAKE